MSGATATRAATKNSSTIVGDDLICAATEIVTCSFAKVVTLTAINDIQVSERSTDGTMMTERPEQDLAEGRPGSRFVRACSTTNWKRYHNPMISVANQSNLDFDRTAPRLAGGLTCSIAGVF